MDSISKYKPNPQITTFDFDETLPEEELSFILLNNLVVARKIQDATFLAIGKMLKIIRDRKLYIHLDFENFSQFLASEEISFSREKAYVCIRTYELYVEQLHFNPEDIARMGVVRLMMLAPVVRDMEDKEEAVKKIEEMKDLRYGDFVRAVKKETNTDGKPEVYYSPAVDKWFVNYYDNMTELHSLGNYEKKEGTEKEQ